MVQRGVAPRCCPFFIYTSFFIVVAATDAVDYLHSTARLQVELGSRGVDDEKHHIGEWESRLLGAQHPYPAVDFEEHLTFERVHLIQYRQASVECGDYPLGTLLTDPEAGTRRIHYTSGDSVDVDKSAIGESGTIGD